MTSAVDGGDRAVRQMAGELAALQVRVDAVEAGVRTTQLGNSSLDSGTIAIYDRSAQVRAVVGRQSDGTYVGGVSQNNSTPPPVPAAPQVTTALGAVRITGTGPSVGAWPADFAHYNVYARLLAETFPRLVGTLVHDDDVFVHPVSGGAAVEVSLTSVNLSGTESALSTAVSGTPGQAVAGDLGPGSVNALALAANAVTASALAAGAVTGPALAAGSVTTPSLAAGAVTTPALAAGSVTAANVVAGSLTGDKLAANTITGTSIQAGAIDAARLAADLVLASRIIVGSATGDRLELHPTAGLQGWKGGVRTLYFDVGTGNLTAVGRWATGTTGTRLEVTTDGTLSFYGSDNAVNGQLLNNGTLGVLISAFTSGSRGLFYLQKGISFQAWGNSGASFQNTALAATQDLAQIRSPVVQLMADRRSGSAPVVGGIPRIVFTQIDSAGTNISSALAIYQNGYDGKPGVSNEQQLRWAPADVGLHGSTGLGNLLVVSDYNGTPKPIYASAFQLSSAAKTKSNIRALNRPDGPSGEFFGAFTTAPARRWRYKQPGDLVDDDDPAAGVVPYVPPPGEVLRRRDPALSDAEFADLDDGDTHKWIYEEQPPPPPRVEPDHLFPVAEDLLALAPEVVTVTEGGELLVDLRDALGWVWEAVGRLHARVQRAERGLPRDGVAVPTTALDPAPPVTGGVLFERGGDLLWRNTIGQIRKVA